MPIKVLITYPHFLDFARPTYLPLKKKFLVIENGDISRWTLIVNIYVRDDVEILREKITENWGLSRNTETRIIWD